MYGLMQLKLPLFPSDIMIAIMIKIDVINKVPMKQRYQWSTTEICDSTSY